jgi:hypothetical protein
MKAKIPTGKHEGDEGHEAGSKEARKTGNGNLPSRKAK